MLDTGQSLFARKINEILRPVRNYAESFVDDMAVHSDQWEEHLIHLARFLKTIRDARLTLNLKKCRWAQNRVKFCGEILGSGQRFADPEKVKIVHEMKIPQTKTELRRILEFSYFRLQAKYSGLFNFGEISCFNQHNAVL